MAQQLEGVEPIDVTIKWPDGLPADVMEEIEAVDRRINNGTLSPETGIKRLDGVDEDGAQAELDKIADAGARETAVVGASRPLPNINAKIDLGDNEE